MFLKFNKNEWPESAQPERGIFVILCEKVNCSKIIKMPISNQADCGHLVRFFEIIA